MIPTGWDRSPDEIADAYDRLVDMLPMPAYFYPEVAQFAGDLSGLRVLDVGCGTGALLGHLKAGRTAALHGVEQSAALCVAARRAIGDGARICRGDVQTGLPFGRSTFDVVLMTEVLEHLRRPGDALQEVRRVLRPSGRLILTMPNASAYLPWSRRAERNGGVGRWQAFLPWEHPLKTRQPIDTVYAWEEITALIPAAGFRVTRCRGREALPYLWDWVCLEPWWPLRRLLAILTRARPLADRALNRMGRHRLSYRLFLECHRA